MVNNWPEHVIEYKNLYEANCENKSELPLGSKFLREQVHGQSYVREYCDFVESLEDAQSFSFENERRWLTRFNDEGRWDKYLQALHYFSRETKKEEELIFYSMLIPAATTVTKELCPFIRFEGDKFSITTIKSMAKALLDRGKYLHKLLVSPEDVADLRTDGTLSYPYSDDPVTRYSLFCVPSLGSIKFTLDEIDFEIELRTVDELGVRGIYNIHDKSSDSAIKFHGGLTNKFNDYQIINGNIMDKNGSLVKAGETQVYGFTKDTRDIFKISITDDCRAYYLSVEEEKTGLKVTRSLDSVCLGNSEIVMGILDRTVKD